MPSSILARVESVSVPGRLLHVVADTQAMPDTRIDLSDSREALQVSLVPLPLGRSVPPHIHVARSAASLPAVTQESWIVLRGAIDVRLFDDDGAFITRMRLTAGQLLVTFGGGHALESSDPDTLLLECKNGPYLGRDYSLIEGTTK